MGVNKKSELVQTKHYTIKYIVSGHIIERYEYQKIFERGSKKDKTGGRNHEADPDNKKRHRTETLQKARNKIRRMINANSDMNTFITLTYAENIQDISYSNNEFKKFIQKMQYRYDNKFKYVAVIEFQDRGAIHYHMLSNLKVDFKIADWRLNNKGEKYRRKTDKQKQYEVEFRDNIWKHGNVDIRPLKTEKGIEIDNVGAYICKYMSEDLDDIRLHGKKLYLNSKNLNESEEILLNKKEIDVLENVYNLNNCAVALENTYYNDYIGKMTYRQYNLKRLGLIDK